MTKVAAVVMAHQKRRRWAETLACRLDCPIVWDHHNDRVETGLRSLQAYERTATHHLVVQDDAIICQDLIAGLEQAVEISQDRIVGLYIGAGRPLSRFRLNQLARGADQQHAAWIDWRGTIWGVAVLIPTVHLDGLIRSYQRGPLRNYDTRLENSARKRRVQWWYTWPSLVDHRDVDENPSLAHPNHPDARKPGRVAYRFVGADTSALTVDWSAGVYQT